MPRSARAGHVRSEHVCWLAAARGSTATMRPPYITAMRSDERENLGEVGRDEQHRLPGVARFAQAARE